MYRTLLFILSIAWVLCACNRTTADLRVGPRQTFLLGEYESQSYRANLDNTGRTDVTVVIVGKADRAERQILTLPAGKSAELNVAADEEVRIINADKQEARILTKLSRGVEGMRYLKPTDGRENTVAEHMAPRTFAGKASDRELGDRYAATLPPARRLIVGEGTAAAYRVVLTVRGNDATRVSVRNRADGRQTQGFGQRGKQELYIGATEVLHLVNEGKRPARLSFRFDRTVVGARMIER